MKYRLMIKVKVTARRAPQGARGLKFQTGAEAEPNTARVAPRKGRVG